MLAIQPPDPSLVRAWLDFLTPAAVAFLTVVQILGQRRATRRAIEVAAKVDRVATTAAVSAKRAEDHASNIAAAVQQNATVVAEKVDKVASVAAETAARADEQATKIAAVAEKTHILVNSQYGLALAMILDKAVRLAELTGSADDKADVAKARQKLADHQARQSVVDATTGK